MSCLTPWNPIPACNTQGGMVALDGPPSGIVSWNGANKRWAIILDDGTLPGDLYFQRFSDGGALLGTPLTLNRLDGSATFAGAVTLAADPTIPLGAATKQYVDRVASTAPAMIAETLYYHASSGQTVFNLGTPDRSGNTGVLSSVAPVMVYANGNRQPLGDAYTVDVPHNAITFLYPLGLGDSVVFDLAALTPLPLVGPALKMEALAITQANTLPPLSYVPDGNVAIVFVNGSAFFAIGPNPAFTITAGSNVLTWSSLIFAVPVGATVIVEYTYV